MKDIFSFIPYLVVDVFGFKLSTSAILVDF